MKKPHAGFWLATLGLGVCWLLALLTRDRLNGILLAGAALALILPRRPPQRRGLGGIGMDGLWSYSGVLHYSGQHGLPLWAIALWIGFGCWWYWLLDVVRAAPAAGGAGRRRRPSPTPCLEAGRPAARRAAGVHAAAAGGRLVDLSARRQLAAVETTGQLNGGQRPGKIMPQAIAYRLPDRVY